MHRTLALVIAASLLLSATHAATPPEAPAKPSFLPSLLQGTSTAKSAGSLSGFSTDQLTGSLKEALGNGLQHAVSSLGKSGGFLTNLNVKIPMPEKLKTVEKTLRSLHQERLADDFINTMNQAAEQAVLTAADVFTASLKTMSVEDAKSILTGPKDAATQFFRRTTGTELTAKFLPVVQQATAKTGATAAYKKLIEKGRSALPFFSTPGLDVDSYVTDKALDGLFKMVAEEEARIRENPVARSTSLLKSVFVALKP